MHSETSFVSLVVKIFDLTRKPDRLSFVPQYLRQDRPKPVKTLFASQLQSPSLYSSERSLRAHVPGSSNRSTCLPHKHPWCSPAQETSRQNPAPCPRV